MGQEPSKGSAPVTDTREPQEIREDIEATRHELGDTVASLAEKTNVKGQVKHKVDETKAAVTEKKDDLLGKAKQASPDQAAAAASQATQKARENPLPLAAAGAFAAGFLLGRVSKQSD